MTRRAFDPNQAGGLIRQLSTERLKVTDRGIDALSFHVDRFGPDETNRFMIDRLRQIVRGEIVSTHFDLNYYAHELRELVRYRRQGFPTGAGDDYDLWNNIHSATLEDYGLEDLDVEGNRTLFHPDAWPFFPR